MPLRRNGEMYNSLAQCRCAVQRDSFIRLFFCRIVFNWRQCWNKSSIFLHKIDFINIMLECFIKTVFEKYVTLFVYKATEIWCKVCYILFNRRLIETVSVSKWYVRAFFKISQAPFECIKLFQTFPQNYNQI